MRVTLLIVLGFLVIAGGGFYVLMRTISEDIERQYSQASEEPLVDFAHLLASLVERDVADDRIDPARLKAAFADAYRREFTARIHQLEKSEIHTHVYVADEDGIVIFDSDGGRREGEDYSRYNDVYLAHRGEYGARASRSDPDNPRTTVFFVAAPIRDADGGILGTLSVHRPETAMAPFAEESRRLLVRASVLTAVVVFLLGAVWSYLVLSPIRRLTREALRVAEGEETTIPVTGMGEFRSLSRALETMRRELEGKHYVENYVQALTHELKSPLAAIRGAAELIDEEMPPEKRQRFLRNILSETTRSEDLVRRLVRLAAIESQTELRQRERMDLVALVDEEVDGLSAVIEMRRLRIVREGFDSTTEIEGDPLMLRIAVRNGLVNACDFSPEGEVVTLVMRRASDGSVRLRIGDRGPGIPEYAAGRVFDRFYSLKNEVTGRKGSGIGLTFVRSTMRLHGGEATLENREGGGAELCMIFAAGAGRPAR